MQDDMRILRHHWERSWAASVALSLLVALSLAGCGITAVNIPGVGYFDFDPAPLTHGDKALQYMALAEAARQRSIGAVVTWVNEDSGHRGKFIVTRLNPRLPMPGEYNYRGIVCDPRYAGGPVHSVEVTEEIYSEGREYITSGLGFYRGASGRWFRCK